MSRKEYLLQQKEKGRRIFGVFPALYPKEVFWALDTVPVEIWDPPLQVAAASAHLQPYICSVVRLGLELVLQGKTGFLDGFLFPHTCDSMQNLASLINDHIKGPQACHFFYHPKEPYGKGARAFYRHELEGLAQSLEGQLGVLKNEALQEQMAQGQKISGLFQNLYDLRAQDKLDMSNRAFYEAIRRNEFLFPDDLIPELEGHVKKGGEAKARGGVPVILSGVLPNPPELLTLLDELEIRVAHDDLLACSRRLLVPQATRVDPYEQLVERYFSMNPCSTKGSSISRREAYLLGLLQKTGAKGVIFNVVKFCEPEWFDVPNLVEGLKRQGVPSLVLDTELNQGLSGQMATRVEAFTEMIG